MRRFRATSGSEARATRRFTLDSPYRLTYGAARDKRFTMTRYHKLPNARNVGRERKALRILGLRHLLSEADRPVPHDRDTYQQVAGLLLRVIQDTGETPDAICRRLGITGQRRNQLLTGARNGKQWFRGHSPFGDFEHGPNRWHNRRSKFDAITGEPVAGPALRAHKQNLALPPALAVTPKPAAPYKRNHSPRQTTESIQTREQLEAWYREEKAKTEYTPPPLDIDL
jgi:hypothetical protein